MWIETNQAESEAELALLCLKHYAPNHAILTTEFQMKTRSIQLLWHEISFHWGNLWGGDNFELIPINSRGTGNIGAVEAPCLLALIKTVKFFDFPIVLP